MTDQILHDLYYDTKNPNSFSSTQKLYQAVKHHKISLKEVQDWLSKQITYTLHKPRRVRFTRNPTVVSSVDEQWQADLVDMSEFAKENGNMKYLVTVIDIMSKFAFVFATKSKKSNDVASGFEKIFQTRQPIILQTDQGGEFENKIMSDLLKKYGIRYFSTRNTETKCAVVERFNRTLRSRMFKYFTSKGTRKYIDILQDLVSAYNNSVHSSIKMRPVDVTSKDEQTLFRRLYGSNSVRDLYLKKSCKEPLLEKGDTVRIQYMKNSFSKGYYPTWTDETYTISKVVKDIDKPQYTLRDYQGKEIEGRFYPEEVQLYTGSEYRVEKILKSRRRNGIKQVLVKWLNFGNEHNSWINETDVGDVS